MARHRLDRRKVKNHHSYTIDEAARIIRASKGTVRPWLDKTFPQPPTAAVLNSARILRTTDQETRPSVPPPGTGLGKVRTAPPAGMGNRLTTPPGTPPFAGGEPFTGK